jgi:hypothetical protein
LAQAYFILLNKAVDNNNIKFIKLEEIDKVAEIIGTNIDIIPNYKASNKRTSKNHIKYKISANDKYDNMYYNIINNIPHNRYYIINKNNKHIK